MPKTVFIAHPMTGDHEGNTRKIVEICRLVHSEDVIPVHPSFTTRRYFTEDPRDRELAKAHIEEYFKRGMVDEVWLYGDRITAGMRREIALAEKYNVRVVAHSLETAMQMKNRFEGA